MVYSIPDTPYTDSKGSDKDIKIATRDIVLLSDDQVPIEVMTDLIFEDIGGQEMINIARNDIINGQDVIYQPIKNLTSLFFQYNPQNILSLQDTSQMIFRTFPISLENRIPNIGTGPNGEIVYLDPTTGNLVINVINLAKDEQIEVQIQINGDRFNDTIYEVEE
jgi:hypothetical protein